MNEEIKEELNAKFLCSQKFAQEIEDIVKNTHVNYIDAIVTYCEIENIELDTISKLVSKPLKEKITLEAQNLNYIPKTGQLPV